MELDGRVPGDDLEQTPPMPPIEAGIKRWRKNNKGTDRPFFPGG
jgi:hypothetical protein